MNDLHEILPKQGSRAPTINIDVGRLEELHEHNIAIICAVHANYFTCLVQYAHFSMIKATVTI